MKGRARLTEKRATLTQVKMEPANMLPLRRGDSYSIILDLPMYDSFKFPLNHNNYSSKSFKSISDYYVKGFYLNIIYVILSSNMISASKQTFNFTEINIYNNSYEASQHIFPGEVTS